MQFGEPGGWSLTLLGIAVGKRHPWRTAVPCAHQRAHLEEALRGAVHNGYTISRGEIFVGAVAVAVPYFDHRGSVVGSVGIYGPAARVSEEKISSTTVVHPHSNEAGVLGLVPNLHLLRSMSA